MSDFISTVNRRLLLCIPRGGLNDTLCQIELCRAHAEKHSRTLVLDTTKSGLLGHFDDFFAFKTRQIVLPRVTPEIIAELNTLEAYPATLKGRFGGYRSHYSKDFGNYVDAETQTPLRFDLWKDHAAQLLVHEQCGGGMGSAKLFDHIELSETMMSAVDGALSNLPTEYIGLHIRNTDYKTDYASFVDGVADQIGDRQILVCSDDPGAIDYCRSAIGANRVHTVTETPNPRGWGLHQAGTHDNDEARHQAARNSIVDLIALGNATDVLFTNAAHGYPSGYSMLAKFLCDHKRVLAQLRQVQDFDEVALQS
jgi:hypothetical protein